VVCCFLWYADSAEHIVYGRLLTRLAKVGMIVGTQQMSLLPVTPEEFLELANEPLSAETLERRARERARSAQQRTASPAGLPGCSVPSRQRPEAETDGAVCGGGPGMIEARD
jgi:hypothetical protein